MRTRIRAAGVAIHNDCILLHRCLDFWVLPGGEVERESSADALVRECSEELGLPARVGRFLWIVENFFDYEGELEQSIEFYYELSFPHHAEIYKQSQIQGYEHEGDEPLLFIWQPLEQLEEITILPECLPSRLKACQHGLPQQIEHVVNNQPE
ncbi:BH3726 [Halalkalibacterium halodurans C-125]|uniref:BH3726 protein n=1 Tax=Halalkalibacterium halodurans (strain ATCC BAA-125 / DSM 18197 / FERM 7344 / JCM 9153 / C-125) TaxID=272558 RepID=Q9K6K3_HALH5|nr:NUDIX domain-containing protein [Halalkalibacterium halodurans]BAB07445.1 BH3726 [Halalkalibacterium halodurans C-125]